jgi:capsular exopolysaccharide synthesis family protein
MKVLPPNIDDPPREGTLDLSELTSTIGRRKFLVLGIAVAVTLLAALYSYSRTPVYTSTAEVLVRPILTNPLESIPLDRISLQTEIRIATAGAVADLARDRMGSEDSPTSLLKKVAVTAPQDTQVLEFAYSDPGAQEAQRGADAFANAYLDFKADQAVESIAQHTSTLQASIDELDGEIRDLNDKVSKAIEGTPEWKDLVDRRNAVETTRLAVQNQLATVSSLSINPGEVIQPAVLPTSPSHPDHRIDLMLGALLGVVIGVGTALASERRRDRIGSQASLEQILEAPVLGVIPRMSPGQRKATRPVIVQDPRSPVAEAFRTLRTNLLAVSERPPVQSLLVTSASSGEGKTTTAATIAAAVAQLGRDVVLISADLRFPRVHTLLGLSNDRGLGQVLTGQLDLEEALCESTIPRLRVLPSGPIDEVEEPVGLIQSETMLDVIARCSESALLIIDGPPIMSVADSLVLATMVDAVLFVADAETGQRVAIVQSRYLLRQLDARVVGGVLNNVDGWSASRGGYGTYDQRRGLLDRILVPERNRGGRAPVEPSEVET